MCYSSPDRKVSETLLETGFSPEVELPHIIAIDITENEPTIDINKNLPPNQYDEVKRLIEENYVKPTNSDEPYEYEFDIHLNSA